MQGVGVAVVLEAGFFFAGMAALANPKQRFEQEKR